jgi:GDP-4-dehydro-6-deoxy-D-mannose reductase
VSVVGIGRRDAPADWYGDWRVADVRDRAAVATAIARAQPDAVFHLAGARTGTLAALNETHVAGLEHVLDAVDRHAAGARVVVVGSSAEVGAADGPVRAGTPLAPVTDYGRSKAAQSALAQRRGAVRARTYNLVGPGLADTLAAGAFARAVAEVEAGIRPPLLRTGPLDTARDLVDVRDAAEAWIALAGAESDGPYEVGTGVATRTGDVLALLIRISGVELEVAPPPSVRADDVLVQVCDPTRLRDATGWTPRSPLERSLSDLLESWRTRVAQTT